MAYIISQWLMTSIQIKLPVFQIVFSFDCVELFSPLNKIKMLPLHLSVSATVFFSLGPHITTKHAYEPDSLLHPKECASDCWTGPTRTNTWAINNGYRLQINKNLAIGCMCSSLMMWNQAPKNVFLLVRSNLQHWCFSKQQHGSLITNG